MSSRFRIVEAKVNGQDEYRVYMDMKHKETFETAHEAMQYIVLFQKMLAIEKASIADDEDKKK